MLNQPKIPRLRSIGARNDPRIQELQALLKVCAADHSVLGRRDAALLGLLYGCHIENLEACALDVADYKTKTQELHIRQGKPRCVRVPEDVAYLLAAWIMVRGTEPGPLFYGIRSGNGIRTLKFQKSRLHFATIGEIVNKRAAEADIARAIHGNRRTRLKFFHSLIEEWVGDLRVRDLSPNTCAAYALDLREVSVFLHGKLEEATRDDISRFARSLLDRPLSATSRSRKISTIREFFEWLSRRQDKPFSAARDLRPPRKRRKMHHWWGVDEIAQFRAVIQGDSPTANRDRAMFELGLTGLRVSEVTSLNLDDIRDLSSPTRAVLIVTRKGPKQQPVPPTPEARAALRKWLSVRPVTPTPALFFRLPFWPHRGCERLKYYSVEKIFKHYAAKAGLPLKKGQSFHILRHSVGQALADNGVPAQDIQALLGHSDIKTTQVYFWVSDERVRQTVQRLQHALSRKTIPPVDERE